MNIINQDRINKIHMIQPKILAAVLNHVNYVNPVKYRSAELDC